MAKVKNAKRVVDSLKRTIEKITKDKSMLKNVGTMVTKEIVAQARLGKQGDKESLGTTTDAWKKRKKKLSTVNPTDTFYKNTNKSRLSFTGEFLKSLSYKIKKGKIYISAYGYHKGYRNLDGSRGKSVKNEKILEGQSGQGRKILQKSKKITKLVKSEVERNARRYIAKFNKRK